MNGFKLLSETFNKKSLKKEILSYDLMDIVDFKNISDNFSKKIYNVNSYPNKINTNNYKPNEYNIGYDIISNPNLIMPFDNKINAQKFYENYVVPNKNEKTTIPKN